MNLPGRYHLNWVVFKTMVNSYSHENCGLLLCFGKNFRLQATADEVDVTTKPSFSEN